MSSRDHLGRASSQLPPAFRGASPEPKPHWSATWIAWGKRLAGKASPVFQSAAASVADFATKKTGRLTTASEVKVLALIVGGVSASFTALLSLLIFAAMVESTVLSPAGSGAPNSAGEWDNSFESKMVRGFHENGGSLNYTTDPNNK